MDIALTLLAVLALLLLGVGLAPSLRGRSDLARRIAGDAPLIPNAPGPSLRTNDTDSVWARTVEAVERRGLSLDDSKGEALAQRLAQAGYPQSWAPRAFVLIRTVLTLALPAAVLLPLWALGADMSGTSLYLVGALLAVAGLYLPNMIVNREAAARREAVINGFPDALDLMLICVESGLGLDAAFSRVGREISLLHPLLSELLAGVSLQLRAGRSRAAALNAMAQRSGVPEVSAFATLIIQSDLLGASIGKTLRVYATEMREARRMRAEERAYRLPVLISIPLVLCMLPTIIGVVMLPSVIALKEVFVESAK
jgi:tight adherence protein C